LHLCTFSSCFLEWWCLLYIKSIILKFKIRESILSSVWRMLLLFISHIQFYISSFFGIPWLKHQFRKTRRRVLRTTFRWEWWKCCHEDCRAAQWGKINPFIIASILNKKTNFWSVCHEQSFLYLHWELII